MRKLYYLKPKIQHGFTSFFTILTSIEIVVFGFLLYIIENLSIHPSYDIMLYIRFSIILVVVLVFTGFNFWYGVRLSHRIAGPIIQIQRVLEQALKDKFNNRIHLRSNDYLHEISDTLNLLLEKLENQQKEEARILESHK